jgi:hypothetical protein
MVARQQGPSCCVWPRVGGAACGQRCGAFRVRHVCKFPVSAGLYLVTKRRIQKTDLSFFPAYVLFYYTERQFFVKSRTLMLFFIYLMHFMRHKNFYKDNVFVVCIVIVCSLHTDFFCCVQRILEKLSAFKAGF